MRQVIHLLHDIAQLHKNQTQMLGFSFHSQSHLTTIKYILRFTNLTVCFQAKRLEKSNYLSLHQFAPIRFLLFLQTEGKGDVIFERRLDTHQAHKE